MVLLLFAAYSFFLYLGQCFIFQDVCFVNLFFNHIRKKTSINSGNQWVLWLSWTEPICHKYEMLFAGTKRFHLWQISVYLQKIRIEWYNPAAYFILAPRKVTSYICVECSPLSTKMYLAKWKGELCQCWKQVVKEHLCFSTSCTCGALRRSSFCTPFFWSCCAILHSEPPLKPILELYVNVQ